MIDSLWRSTKQSIGNDTQAAVLSHDRTAHHSKSRRNTSRVCNTGFDFFIIVFSLVRNAFSFTILFKILLLLCVACSHRQLHCSLIVRQPVLRSTPTQSPIRGQPQARQAPTRSFHWSIRTRSFASCFPSQR